MYQMIAFDMDGTLLNSKKQISPEDQTAITKAFQAGKTVILNTGRCIAELEEYLRVIPEVRYLNCSSGAIVYDLREKKILYSALLESEIIKKILDFAALENAMPHIMLEKSYIQKNHLEEMARYGMGGYKMMFERVAEKWDDLAQEYARNAFSAAKINLYHTDPVSRSRTEARIREAGLEVTMVQAETTALEISAEGVDKGSGLEHLCRYIGVPVSQTIVVGDADNDVGALKKAGLAVAMGNANAAVKGIADVYVADCDENGCAEAIEKYLLHGET